MSSRRPIAVALALAAAGCSEPPLPVQPLPALVAAPAARPVPIAVAAPVLIPGERLSWEVSWRGLSIGRLQLATGAAQATAPSARQITVDSEFRTGGLAGRAAPIRYRLTTRAALPGALPIESSEQLSFGGETRRTDAAFRGAHARARSRSSGRPARRYLRVAPDRIAVHSLHTALAALRAWSATGCCAGYLFVLHEHQLFRIDVARPSTDDRGVRLDCRATRVAKMPERVLTFTLWVTNDAARTPVRIEAESDRGRVAAELVDRSL